jgi:class 3 adenylate cyclase
MITVPAKTATLPFNLPDRETLTFTNGFYAYCTALFIDIRESSELPSIYKRPALAKIYRAFISEMVAIFNSHINAREINIVGDCVWGVYNTPRVSDIDTVLSLAAIANSLTQVLNYKFKQNGYDVPLRFGIGMSFGRALMIKAGYNGSRISDVVYMGDVVSQAAKLASRGSKGWGIPPIFVDELVYSNLNEYNQGLLRLVDNLESLYGGDIVNKAMDEWYESNCI